MAEPTVEVNRLEDRLKLAEKYIRELRTWRTQVGSGAFVRASSIGGVIPSTNLNPNGGFSVAFGDSTNVVPLGIVTAFECPFAFRITEWSVTAKEAGGSIVIDVWRDSYANYPPTVADTIAGSEKPTLVAQQKNQDTALGTWSTDCAKGDWIILNIDSISLVTRATLALRFTRL